VKRLYYGSVTIEQYGLGKTTFINNCMVAFASSADEAKGLLVTKSMSIHPQGKVALVQMFQIEDDCILDAARILRDSAETPK